MAGRVKDTTEKSRIINRRSQLDTPYPTAPLLPYRKARLSPSHAAASHVHTEYTRTSNRSRSLHSGLG